MFGHIRLNAFLMNSRKYFDGEFVDFLRHRVFALGMRVPEPSVKVLKGIADPIEESAEF